MCLTYCHQRAIFFDSDADDVCGVCSFNRRKEQACETCEHRRDGVCGKLAGVEPKACALARAPQPARGWCCHYNARPASGWQCVTPEQVRGHLRRDLRRGGVGDAGGSLEFIFRLYDAEYRLVEGVCQVWLESLAVPLVYGVPVEHWLSVETEVKAEAETGLNLTNLEWL